MLDFKRVLTAKPKAHEQADLQPLITQWGREVDPCCVLQEHPRPAFARADVAMLNGLWKCGISGEAGSAAPAAVDLGQLEAPAEADCPQDILVPFSPETALSGVGEQLQPGQTLRYWRTFTVAAPARGVLPVRAAGNSDARPAHIPKPQPDQRVLLHFDGVDHACAVWLNGTLLGTHTGAYLPFSYDITDLLLVGENHLALAVADATNPAQQLTCKQRLSRGDIWYTAQSGIWQPVWLETVPAVRIESFTYQANIESGQLAVNARVNCKGTLTVQVYAPSEGEPRPTGTLLTQASAPSWSGQARVELQVPNPQLWSPQSPTLYPLRLTFEDDQVNTYVAFRRVEVRPDAEGTPRFFLNGEPYFVKGALDQGYWPESLLTPPSDAALQADIQAVKSAGFNMLRKHIKLENSRWYYHADRLGLLVWQDMPCGGGSDVCTWHVSYKPTLFKASWTRMRDNTARNQRKLGAASEALRAEWAVTLRGIIQHLRNHPSVCCWVLFNEGWGQFDAAKATAQAAALDPTRPIDAVSGWFDQGCSSFYDVHNYFRPLQVWPSRPARAFFLGEFGGLSFGVPDHCAGQSDYGYATYESQTAWWQAVRETLANAESLQPKGLAGYVYSQLTDVEEETNGLLTYDRQPKWADAHAGEC
ncbi:MAG: glycoside hydrolase family 2 TIM barrel-domain containing protein [Coriobacteriia bacterium]|nr:glycoside hydrolase family 2 TIM barrel-domain containing protein [Coriobacteriia bacterium]